MAALLEGAFTSNLHTFIVGDEKIEITVHAEVIAKQSKELNVLLNGKMAEAQSGKTILEDVSKDIFIRFCQFAYTGNYSTPEFVRVQKATRSGVSAVGGLLGNAVPETTSETLPAGWAFDVPQDETEAAELIVEEHPVEEATAEVIVAEYPAAESPVADGFSSWGVIKPKKSKKAPSKSVILRQELDDLNYNQTTTQLATEVRCQIRQNNSPEEDYTPVFLGHAELYVFADKWHIDDLKMLTLNKLHSTLTSFKLYEARRGDIVELAKFAYSNNNTADKDGSVDDLRALVTHYVTCELENLVKTPKFLAFLEEPGQFSRDLVRMMMRRIE